MNNIDRPEFDKFIHKVRNPLNSITLHAELGKILLDENANKEQIKDAFTVILEQCVWCEKILSEMRNKSDSE